MIRTEKEYSLAIQDYTDACQRLAQLRVSLVQQGYDDATIADLMDSELSFNTQLKFDIETYERACKRQFRITPYQHVGELLVNLRIANNVPQRDLAARLGVHESSVSRDEHNLYHGVTVERVQKVLDALNEHINLSVPPHTSQHMVGEPSVFHWDTTLSVSVTATSEQRTGSMSQDGAKPGQNAPFVDETKPQVKSVLTTETESSLFQVTAA